MLNPSRPSQRVPVHIYHLYNVLHPLPRPQNLTHGTPGDGLDGFSRLKNFKIDPFFSSYWSKVRFRGFGSGWSTWYTLYTCTGPRGTPGDSLDGFSTPKNPQFDPSHPSIAPTSQKLDSEGVAVGGAPGTRGTHVQGHVGHLGMV